MDTLTTNVSRLNALQGPGIIPQILYSCIVIVILYLVFMFIEIIYNYINRLRMSRTELLPDTNDMAYKSITIPQNPNNKAAKPVYLSDNERSGIEFTYSFYLNINPSTFRTEKGLLHIFHKGFSTQFPLLAPGVYMRSDTNTLRVYMNTYKTWNNYVEVDNFPVGKWVHVAIVCKNTAMELFINGNLSRKLSFNGYLPYQNYEDICCFSQRRITLKHSIIPSLNGEDLDIFGYATGFLSRLSYFSYALSYGEINSLMNEGPSNKMASSTTDVNVPPYLDDTWWSKGN
jgi:hypothetical protein